MNIVLEQLNQSWQSDPIATAIASVAIGGIVGVGITFGGAIASVAIGTAMFATGFVEAVKNR